MFRDNSKSQLFAFLKRLLVRLNISMLVSHLCGNFSRNKKKWKSPKSHQERCEKYSPTASHTHIDFFPSSSHYTLPVPPGKNDFSLRFFTVSLSLEWASIMPDVDFDYITWMKKSLSEWSQLIKMENFFLSNSNVKLWINIYLCFFGMLLRVLRVLEIIMMLPVKWTLQFNCQWQAQEGQLRKPTSWQESEVIFFFFHILVSIRLVIPRFFHMCCWWYLKLSLKALSVLCWALLRAVKRWLYV